MGQPCQPPRTNGWDKHEQIQASLTNKIAVLEVEAVQLVAGLLRIHDILVYDEGGALGVVRNTLSDLAKKRTTG